LQIADLEEIFNKSTDDAHSVAKTSGPTATETKSQQLGVAASLINGEI